MSTYRALVVENDPTDDARRLGQWLTEAGLDLAVVRAHAGEALPDTPQEYAALVVLGGAQQAYSGLDGAPGAPWLPAVEALLRGKRATRETFEAASRVAVEGARPLAHNGFKVALVQRTIVRALLEVTR